MKSFLAAAQGGIEKAGKVGVELHSIMPVVLSEAEMLSLCGECRRIVQDEFGPIAQQLDETGGLSGQGFPKIGALDIAVKEIALLCGKGLGEIKLAVAAGVFRERKALAVVLSEGRTSSEEGREMLENAGFSDTVGSDETQARDGRIRPRVTQVEVGEREIGIPDEKEPFQDGNV